MDVNKLNPLAARLTADCLRRCAQIAADADSTEKYRDAAQRLEALVLDSTLPVETVNHGPGRVR